MTTEKSERMEEDRRTTRSLFDVDPVTGDRVESLCTWGLGLSVADIHYLFAMNPVGWSSIHQTNKRHRQVRDATMCLMTRWLERHPEKAPVPSLSHELAQVWDKAPRHAEMADVVDFLAEVGERADGKATAARLISLYLGRDASSAYRWGTAQGKATPVVRNAAMTLMRAIRRDGPQAWKEWREVAEEEARARGMDGVSSRKSWISDPEGQPADGVNGNRIERLSLGLGLGTPDTLWLFGLTPMAWSAMRNDEYAILVRDALGKEEEVPVPSGSRARLEQRLNWDRSLTDRIGPREIVSIRHVRDRSRDTVDKPTIGILVRWLERHPEDCIIPIWSDVADVYDLLNERLEGAGFPAIPAKHLSLALGRDASSGSRWLSTGSGESKRTTPIVDRLATLLQQAIEERGLDAWREWASMVEAEATSRDISTVWRSRGWTERKKRAA
ncbi:hypothetical protein CKO28_13360 [Rhodovibrio sodomensis]|uniref:Core-binding (CB) domain-containing protein n=1 Tax=Rhodovibrio sodomensis TaxID=1088 RepID=A0ABS1DI05_9PROT|nr:hypothetical protein [Rhodovibrio sodomensis]MBK1669020.1 hypothetical protein [Rhodovibrio sodomensis]